RHVRGAEYVGLVLSAFIFGLVASSALVIGAVAGAYWTPPRPLIASALAFASGALITALAFDLFQESFIRGGAWLSSIGLLLGAAAFVVADEALDRYIEGVGSGVSAFALLAAVTLDGIPENMALGVSLLETSTGGTLTLLVAIFLSNLPESLGGPWECASRAAPDASPSESGASPRSYSPSRWCSATWPSPALEKERSPYCSPSPGAQCSPRWPTL
ncbi:MAG: ZIP family metal transporter, partial [Rubrobacter sp.]